MSPARETASAPVFSPGNDRTWPAPAKINLFLHITGRRADGYHTLQTVFQFLDYGDDISFVVRDDGRIERRRDLIGVPKESDLTLRAARLLKDHAGVHLGADIIMNKRLPAGGGLGGGSSDAATTLLALNHLWETKLSRDELAELGLALGADVPVFIDGRSCWAEGIGEVVTPIDLEEPWYVVVAPPVHVSTAEIFHTLDLTGHSPPIKIRDFRGGQTRNDLEAVVRRRHPEVDSALRFLASYGQPRMTGSGSCVFLAVTSADEGETIMNAMPQGMTGFVARGQNRHPLYSLDSQRR